MQEMQVLFLDREDPLQEEMANHSNILAWKTPWTEEPGGLQSRSVRHDLGTKQQQCVHVNPKHISVEHFHSVLYPTVPERSA